MTSRRQRQDRPIESVELTITLKADRELARRIKEEIPSSVVKGWGCEVRIEAQQPAEMVKKARDVLEKLRAIEGSRPRS